MSIKTEYDATARNIHIIIAIFAILTAVSTVIWGPVALAMAALSFVPVFFFFILGVTIE